MVLKFTVLVKAIQNANSHDFTRQSPSGHTDGFVRLHFNGQTVPRLIVHLTVIDFPSCRVDGTEVLSLTYTQENDGQQWCASRLPDCVAVKPCTQTAEPRRCGKVNQRRLEQSAAFHLFRLAACSYESC